MGQTCRSIFAWPHTLAALPCALVLTCTTLQPAHAADDAPEHERLAALVRQIELADRLAEHAASTAPQERARYHFDYDRLRGDLQRVRTGLQDYLVPQRAQPRDPIPLSGDYLRRDAPEKAFP